MLLLKPITPPAVFGWQLTVCSIFDSVATSWLRVSELCCAPNSPPINCFFVCSKMEILKIFPLFSFSRILGVFFCSWFSFDFVWRTPNWKIPYHFGNSKMCKDSEEWPQQPGYDSEEWPQRPGCDSEEWPQRPGYDGEEWPQRPDYDSEEWLQQPGYSEQKR